MDSKEQRRIVKEGYERVAAFYHQDRRADKWGTDELTEFIGYLLKGSRILDAGCGAGIPVLKALTDEGFKVTGVDLSLAMLRLSQKYESRADLIQADLIELCIRKETFDGIVSLYTFIHIPRDYHALVYNQMHAVLKSGGMMLVSTGLISWEGIEDWYGAPMFWSHYDSDMSLAMIKDTGFDVIFNRMVVTGDEKHYWVLARKVEI